MSAIPAPVRDLLREALGVWGAQFDGDDADDATVPAAALVDWFADWRNRLKQAIAAIP